MKPDCLSKMTCVCSSVVVERQSGKRHLLVCGHQASVPFVPNISLRHDWPYLIIGSILMAVSGSEGLLIKRQRLALSSYEIIWDDLRDIHPRALQLLLI